MDIDLRRLERQSDDPNQVAQAIRAKMRADIIPTKNVEMAAFLGDPASQLLAEPWEPEPLYPQPDLDWDDPLMWLLSGNTLPRTLRIQLAVTFLRRHIIYSGKRGATADRILATCLDWIRWLKPRRQQLFNEDTHYDDLGSHLTSVQRKISKQIRELVDEVIAELYSGEESDLPDERRVGLFNAALKSIAYALRAHRSRDVLWVVYQIAP